MDDLVRQALREGRLTVAGGGPAALYTPWAAGFEKQYPGITVQVRGAFSNQLVADIDRQLQSGAPAVDVAILQTPQDFAAFSIAHHITGPAAWTAALVMMALADVTARLVTVWMRGRSLAATAAPVAAASVPAGAGA